MDNASSFENAVNPIDPQKSRSLSLIKLLCVALLSPFAMAAKQTASRDPGKVHTYYVAADEVEWDMRRSCTRMG